ncbi:hypothetical protein ABZ897_00425 [Nonomuraea sp. NPDC046802]|uniref:hypothetical protein n=1 Tax=Nonomuraea sp. NPDC046802 TaxID=3154919 RepID=UPI0033D780AA
MTTPPDESLRIAALDALSRRVNNALADARKEAEPGLAALRVKGVKQLEVALPSGDVVGTISIKAGRDTVTDDEDALLAWVEANKPEEIEHAVSPNALDLPDVVAYIRKLHPGMVGKRVRPAYRAKLLASLDEDGQLANETTGELVQVRKVVKGKPTGEFALTFETAKKGRPNGRDQIANAWQSGDLSITDLIRPALEAGEQS